MPRVDWDYWRNKFVTSDLTLTELSEGHNAPAFKTLRNQSSKENWPEQRKRYRDMLGTQTAVSPDVKATVDQVKKIIDSAEMLTQHLRIFKLVKGKAIEKISKIDPIDLAPREALDYLKWAIDGERLLEGLATQRSEVSGPNGSELIVNVNRNVINASN